jgi:hypothetical protein
MTTDQHSTAPITTPDDAEGPGVISVPTPDISSTPSMASAKPEGVRGPKSAPTVQAQPGKYRHGQSGYARRVQMEAAGTVACSTPTRPPYKDEPHEQDGFPD